MAEIGIGSNLKTIAQQQPNKIAIYYNDQEITYDTFHHNVDVLKQNLQKVSKAKPTKKVAILIGNEPAFLELFFAIVQLGWIAIPFDPKWSKREAIRIMEDSEADLVITNTKFIKTATYAFDSSYDIAYLRKSVADIPVNKPMNFSSIPFYLGFTSGSTGNPKGFIRNHLSWLSSFKAGEEAFQYDHTDTIIAPGPLCHSLSLFGAVHALHIGASFYLTTSFSAPTTFDLLKNGEATVLYAVPTMLNGLARQKGIINKQITILSSGAKLEPTIKNNLKGIFPAAKVYEYYGASELSYVTYATSEQIEKFPHSVGKPFPGVHLSIRDTTGKSVPTNSVGNIYIESDFLFSGYVNNPVATKEVLTKNKATIGDLGFLNEDGVLTIVGREKNMIICGGQNVYPEEVEKVLKELDQVREAIVIGVEDAHWGQQVIALIQWKETKPDSLKQVRDHCRKHLSSYKRPRKYYSVNELPYTPTGKIARKQIEENLDVLTQ